MTSIPLKIRSKYLKNDFFPIGLPWSGSSFFQELFSHTPHVPRPLHMCTLPILTFIRFIKCTTFSFSRHFLSGSPSLLRSSGGSLLFGITKRKKETIPSAKKTVWEETDYLILHWIDNKRHFVENTLVTEFCLSFLNVCSLWLKITNELEWGKEKNILHSN